MKYNPFNVIARASLIACAPFCVISTASAQSGTWIGTSYGDFWSNIANWSGGIVADGAGNNADFSTLDVLEGPFSVVLDTPRTLGSLTFGDTNITAGSAGSWAIDNNGDPLNILTLSGTPTVTVNALGDISGIPATAQINAEIAGTGGLVKAGAGPLVLAVANTFTGSTAVNAGTLSLNAANAYAGGTTVNGGLLNINAATAIGTGTLTIAGGSLGTTTGAALTTNNAQTWNSNVSHVGPLNLNLGTGAVTTGGILREVNTTAGLLTVGGVVTAPGLTKSGAGELALTANNSATLLGPILLKGGTLRMSNAAASGQTGIGPATNTVTFEGGRLVLNGSANTYSGTFSCPMSVASGQTGTMSQMVNGDNNAPLTGAGTFNVELPGTRGDFSGNWSAFTGTINLIDPNAGANGQFRINDFSGNVHFNLATLHIGDGVDVSQWHNPSSGAVGDTRDIGALTGTAGGFLGGHGVAGRFVNWRVGGLNLPTTFAGTIKNGRPETATLGAVRLYKIGTASLTLTGTNTYTGDTQLNAGTLSIGNGGATGSLAATNVITLAGTNLIFNRDNSSASTYPGILSGPGNVFKRGAGRVDFYGVNTYTAGTAIEGGTIGINSASSLGDVAGAVNFTVSDGSILATTPGVIDAHNFNVASGLTASFGASTAADSLEITTPITGAGNLAVNGLGVLTLSGTNTYAGTTTIASGTLVAANVSGSATSAGAVALNGGTLGGTGTIANTVTTATGTSLKPGTVTPTSSAVGTLTLGGLALAGGTTLKAEFASTSSYDTITVTTASALTSTATLGDPVVVDLKLANSVSKWSIPGTYDLIQFTGTFTGNADDLFEVPLASQQVGNTYSFSNTGSAIRLTITGPIPHVWNVDAPGNWTTAGNWDTGAPNGVGAIAHFDSAISGPQSITLDANQTAGTLQFNNANSYTINGISTLALDQFLTADVEIDVLLGSHTISAPLALVDPLAIGLNGTADALSLTGDITGTVSITKISPGNLTLGGNNSSLSGPVTFSNGTLTFANNGLGTGNLTLDNASLVWGTGNTQDITVGRTITFGNNSLTFAMEDDVTLANNFGLTGTANLTKDGAGKLTLTANTTFAGNLTVQNGNLDLGDGGANGSTLGGINLVNAGSTLTVSRTGDHLVANTLSGAGNLVLSGPGIQSLDKANTFSGTTTISAGTAKLLNSLALQNSSLLYNSTGGAVDFDLLTAASFGSLGGDKDLALENPGVLPVALTTGGNGTSTTYTGILSGSGSLTKAGAGTMTLTNVQTYTGATQVNGGILELPVGSSITTTTSAGVGAGTAQLLVNGGTLVSSAFSTINPGFGNGLRINSGSATYNGGLQSGNNDGGLIYVEGGSFTTTNLTLQRTQSYNNLADPNPVAVGDGTGLVVIGGTALITGNFNVGTRDSSASGLVNGATASLTVNGTTNIGQNSGGRWSRLEVRDGTFTSTDATGVVLSPRDTDTTRSQFLVTGGVATVERIGFGDALVDPTSIGRLTVSGGALYVGAGGLQQLSPFVSQIQLFGGTLGAKAPWSSPLAIATANTFTVKAADAVNVAHDITLSGAVTGTGNLVKDGGGILTVSGAYSYTGSTEVDAGTLVLSTATLSDTGTVDVSATGSAVLNLPHGAIDTVADFLIDGVPQGPGTYNAGNTGGRITGTGSLLVLVPDPFTAWVAGFGLVGADALPGADPDFDGQKNFLEFALNSNPTTGASSGKERTAISLVEGENALTYTLPVRTGAVFSGATSQTATIDLLTYLIEGSDALTAWNAMVISEVMPALDSGLPALDTGWTYRTFRTPGDVLADPTDFIRCNVVK